jgi:hypothetical protein
MVPFCQVNDCQRVSDCVDPEARATNRGILKRSRKPETEDKRVLMPPSDHAMLKEQSVISRASSTFRINDENVETRV